MRRVIATEPLIRETFAPFGDVLEVTGPPDVIINQGMCGRYHDKAHLDFPSGRLGISLFDAKPRALPYTLDMMERHPLGCQSFIPMTHESFLVIVAPDDAGKPGAPRAFLTKKGQAVNYHRNVWHGVLTPLSEPGLFAVIDRIGEGNNLEEHWFEEPYVIQ
ncbi:ureidoglycolate lyase [Qingshengfaniella alkalisoli]|uniref:Ureidoglycolate lyase n=1 Tax=Qingshengfaniella alkalisoli TaxID=2599296 RepID=A0A5B8IT86_9RHOB|nr:ureidoglycolate lyase [Qingshengfaniella alkalisoli]QDY68844.1 ureidoglycolate lyase [Qingshengfaniella alkalisoli]